MIGYPVNRGKGGAMKYGFAHIRSTRPQCQVVVTVDCDGQHTAQDVLRVAQDAAKHPGQLVLGVRDFTKTADGTPVPLRPLLPGENFARIAAATVGARLVSMLILLKTCSASTTALWWLSRIVQSSGCCKSTSAWTAAQVFTALKSPALCSA